jgi:hypothetical protein
MSVNYTVTQEGDPVVPIQMDVEFDVNVSVQYVYPVMSTLEFGSQDFNDFFQNYADDVENSAKDNDPIFVTKDTSRSNTFSLVPTGGNNYDITIGFTIQNAVAKVSHGVETTLTGTAREEYLQAQAEYIAGYEKQQRPWTDLP